jgi:hypothetical protein
MAKRTNGLIAALVILLVLAIGAQSCRPRITGIFPTSGPPGTLVHVTGIDLLGGLVKWNAGTPAEITIPGGFLAANFFTVPPDAAPGAYNVRLYGGGSYSAGTMVFTVTGGTRRPAPRIDDITCRNFSIDTMTMPARATFFLLVHGANVDAGAQILIDGVAQPTYLWRGLSNQQNMQVRDPATLGYPIFHYGTLICALANVAPGSILRNITVVNLGGTRSVNSKEYAVASSMRHLDSDGDGLSDVWETYGADIDTNGTIDVNLPALGAKPLRKDIFVEVDWMTTNVPGNELWPYADSVFAQAPILNSDGTSGVSLHVDHGQPGAGGGGGSIIPYYFGIYFLNIPCPYPPAPEWSCQSFYRLKKDNFDSMRLPIYRYCIFGHDGANGSGSGESEGRVSNDFMVTLGTYTGPRDTLVRAQTCTFLHEFGHTFGLLHGGGDGIRRKPNYNSVMSYLYDNEGVDMDCNPDTREYIYTFSQGMRRDLDENCLNEPMGICDNVARDWDGDGVATGTCVRAVADRKEPYTVLRDYCDWSNLVYKFTRDTAWRFN